MMSREITKRELSKDRYLHISRYVHTSGTEVSSSFSALKTYNQTNNMHTREVYDCYTDSLL